MCKCLSILEVYCCIARHLIDLLYPLVQVFIEYRELAFLHLPVSPNHLNEWNNVNQISLGSLMPNILRSSMACLRVVIIVSVLQIRSLGHYEFLARESHRQYGARRFSHYVLCGTT